MATQNTDCAVQTVYNALKAGYRLLDGAGDYGNEKEAGEGLARAIKDGIVKREEVCEYRRVIGSAVPFFSDVIILQGSPPRSVRNCAASESGFGLKHEIRSSGTLTTRRSVPMSSSSTSSSSGALTTSTSSSCTSPSPSRMFPLRPSTHLSGGDWTARSTLVSISLPYTKTRELIFHSQCPHP